MNSLELASWKTVLEHMFESTLAVIRRQSGQVRPSTLALIRWTWKPDC